MRKGPGYWSIDITCLCLKIILRKLEAGEIDTKDQDTARKA